MQLKISGIAKIEDAVIDLKGITVIAGENNTGKSTIGKILFAMNDFMNGFVEYVERDVKTAISSELRAFRDVLDIICKEHYGQNKQFRRKTAKLDHIQAVYTEKIYNLFTGHAEQAVESYLKRYIKQHIELYQVNYEECREEALERLQETSGKIKTLFGLDEHELGVGIVTSSFDQIFKGQINGLGNSNRLGEVILTDDYGKETTVRFTENKCIYVDCNTPMYLSPVFIDNPRTLDLINGNVFFYPFEDTRMGRTLQEFRREQLGNLLRPNHNQLFGGFFRSYEAAPSDINVTIAQKKLKSVNELLKKAAPGEYKSENGELLYQESGMMNPVKLENLSTGLKAMILLEQIISLGLLREGSTLILDEPEINLHPEWQLLYAQIIVLLQEVYNLNIVLTTHSPYFLKAIEMYIAKENRREVCKYYAAENIDGKAVITDRTDSINVLFRMLAEPLRALKLMENEMGRKG